MPKYPNTIKWKDAEYVALKLGWFFRDQSGSHKHYKKDEKKVLTIPVYKEISVNKGHIFPIIIRTMGITKKVFFETIDS